MPEPTERKCGPVTALTHDAEATPYTILTYLYPMHILPVVSRENDGHEESAYLLYGLVPVPTDTTTGCVCIGVCIAFYP